MLLLSTILSVIIQLARSKASVGTECWSHANGAVAGGCPPGTQCGSWQVANGGKWDGQSPWYCLYNSKRTRGQSCNYDKKQGKFCVILLHNILMLKPLSCVHTRPQLVQLNHCHCKLWFRHLWNGIGLSQQLLWNSWQIQLAEMEQNRT